MARYELDNRDAYRMVETLISLADLMEPAGPSRPAYLTDDHLRSLHRLPGSAAATGKCRTNLPTCPVPMSFRETMEDLAE